MTLRTKQVLRQLRAFESRNVTFIDPSGGWPIVWERATGCHVWDADGRRYLDLTAAFGVAAAGHANPRVVRAGQRQMARLLHAMGDVHPHPLKGELAAELNRITYARWTKHTPKPETGKTIFCNSGFEAVEAALKTALLATDRPGVIAFQGGYHGLGYGALNVTARKHFRAGFETQLARFGEFLPFPSFESDLPSLKRSLIALFESGRFGAVLAEPVQARGGMNVPPSGFLELLRTLCDQYGALLILDEIYTGFGRTGNWFACESAQVIPDLVCLGKALTGGFPLSACVGRASLMDRAWPESQGEAIHTSTFLGHPVGCAMALAQIREIEKRGLVERSARLGAELIRLLQQLEPPAGIEATVRGAGLMVGMEFRNGRGEPATTLCLQLVKDLLKAGFILLPEGDAGQVLGFTPPLTVSKAQLKYTVDNLQRLLAQVERGEKLS